MGTAAEAQPGTWIAVGVLVGLALALLVGVLVGGVLRGRRAARARHDPAPAVQPPPAPVAGFAVDDLPGFLDRPPGSDADRGALPAAGQHRAPVADAARTGSTAAAAPAPHRDDGPPGRGGTLGLTASAVLLVAAVLVAFAGGSSVTSPAADASVPGTPTSGGTATPATAAAPSSPAQDADTPAGALALTSVPLADAGIAATATFQGLVLEQRAVGLTVTYPGVSVTTDGRRSLAHVRLPTWNCLTTEPPADPTQANCVPTPTEYADLADPGLQVSRDGDRLELTGRFATYTRPNGTAPVYTGRTYQLAAAFTPDGPVDDGTAPATGVVRIGLDIAPAVTDPGVNRLQHP
ncbi:hypothetical protein GCU67_16960 [Modestobacter muralis]|uniref:Uncharacterized protein n=1 Tax=Modestobacter muralis TaxID=1608614 RepID=A0A6P0EVY2_9ACTN|nr:hypothetical protein [Modestobacter muralis]NEK95841.1 hypothetical protein [Modestobacter muralis]NEN52729.1 hypothetical protein [Modestobacter muralis]